MYCKKCGTKLNQGTPCKNCSRVKTGNRKYYLKKTFKIILYFIAVLIFLLSWAIRKEFIVGPVPVIVHLGIFYFIFLLIKHKVPPIV